MRALALSLALLVAAPVAAGEPRALTPAVDLAKGDPAPFAGTLSDPEAWRVAAQKRLELEREVAELKAKPCEGSSGFTWGLVSAGVVAVAAFVAGVLIAK